MSLLEVFSSVATFFPKRKIGPFSATLTMEESGTDELEITQHPVQQGAAITDHSFVKPASLSVKVIWSSLDAPLSETYQKLLDLQASREPFDVVTGKRIYRNMLFKSLGITTDASTENVLSISAEFLEVIITTLEVVTVPARAKQKRPAKTGGTKKVGVKKAEVVPPAKAETSRSAAKAIVAGLKK